MLFLICGANYVLEQDLPIKTAEDLHREQLIEELQAQSERALREYEAGEGLP